VWGGEWVLGIERDVEGGVSLATLKRIGEGGRAVDELGRRVEELFKEKSNPPHSKACLLSRRMRCLEGGEKKNEALPERGASLDGGRRKIGRVLI